MVMTKIAYISDLHTELQELPGGLNSIAEADIGILVGDMSSAGVLRKKANDAKSRGAKRRFINLLQHLVPKWKEIYYVLGNHECYGANLSDTPKIIEEFLDDNDFGDIRILNNRAYQVKDTDLVVAGATLWTSFYNQNPEAMLRAQFGMADYKWIRNHNNDPLLPQDTVDEHYTSVEWLKSVLQYGDPTIIVTHHAPSVKAEKGRISDLSGAFVNNLDDKFREANIVAWVHGHTHTNYEYMMNHYPVLNNMFGYTGHESTSRTFEIDRVIELPLTSHE